MKDNRLKEIDRNIQQAENLALEMLAIVLIVNPKEVHAISSNDFFIFDNELDK